MSEVYARNMDNDSQFDVLCFAMIGCRSSIELRLEELEKEHLAGLVSHNEQRLKEINECMERTAAAIEQIKGLDKGIL